MWENIGKIKAAGKMRYHPPLHSQVLLESFHSALDKATAQGVQYGKMIRVGEWEFVFGKRATDALPVVIHAKFER